MITQTPISLKIDTMLLEKLNDEARDTWKSRNKLINEAVETYLELKDAQRYQRYQDKTDRKVSEQALRFIKKHLVPNVQYFLDVIDHH